MSGLWEEIQLIFSSSRPRKSFN
jgi:hypothetical protein